MKPHTPRSPSRSLRRRVMPGALALLGAAAVLAPANDASAQYRIPQSNWRQRYRPGRGEHIASPQSFAFELRFGPYAPKIDDEFPNLAEEQRPYQKVFGTGPQFYIGLEFDWLPIRIPWVGALGPGVGWGYTRTSATAQIAGCSSSESSCDSAQDTALTIMPMHLSAVLRADGPMRAWGVPLVPYVKLGEGFATWSSDSDYNGVAGSGTSFGMHLAVGGMLALNWLDERAAISLDETTGVNHAYFFAEWMRSDLGGMKVGTSTWVLGLALDM